MIELPLRLSEVLGLIGCRCQAISYAVFLLPKIARDFKDSYPKTKIRKNYLDPRLSDHLRLRINTVFRCSYVRRFFPTKVRNVESPRCLPSDVPYVRHVCSLLCNIAKPRVRATVTMGFFLRLSKHCKEKLICQNEAQTVILSTGKLILDSLFYSLLLLSKLPLHNSSDFL